MTGAHGRGDRRRRVFVKLTLKGESIVADFLKLLDDYVERRYSGARKGK